MIDSIIVLIDSITTVLSDCLQQVIYLPIITTPSGGLCGRLRSSFLESRAQTIRLSAVVRCRSEYRYDRHAPNVAHRRFGCLPS